MKSYSELINIESFKDRLKYLQLNGEIGIETFGSKRYLNQKFYTSNEWKTIRNQVIIRDNGCDLAFPEYVIGGRIYIHHINPLSPEQFKNYDEFLEEYNSLENLICCSAETHNAIHYGTDINIREEPIERKPNDQNPWR